MPRLYILAVDDESDLLMLFQRRLTEKGFKVQTLLNACNFWETVQLQHPDIIFMDIEMKGVNGADLCRQLKKDPSTASIPVVMLSACINIEESAQACAADGFICKPYSTEKILAEIKRILN